MHTQSVAPLEPTAPAAAKATSIGTHRVRPAEQTWEWIHPILPWCGITRVADITWLDEIGIPVYQAIRPNAHTLSVSQGKGATPMLARVSAAMEAVELWHAEHPDVPTKIAPVEEIEPELGYPLDALPLSGRHFVGPDCRFEWFAAQRIDRTGPSYLPSSLLRLDSCVTGRWTPPAFRATSNGLASGNVLDEALLHGLYEVVERDASARARRDGSGRVLDLDSVQDPTARQLVDQLAAAEIDVTVRFLPSPFGVPTFDTTITSALFPVPFGGVGTHLDAGIALCRALTEAAQSRASFIAGTRDDLGRTPYREAHFSLVNRSPSSAPSTVCRDDPIDFAAVESGSLSDVRQEAIQVASRIESVTGHPPLFVDLTRAELGVPVAHVVCPGTLIDISH